MSHRPSTALGCFFAIIPAYLFAQDATITGIVTDSAQALIPGVQIKILNVDSGAVRAIQADHEGNFTVTNLPPGHYELTAEHEGFRGYRKTDIILETGQNVRSDIQLTIGNVTESVSVTPQIATLNTENGAIKGDVIVGVPRANQRILGRVRAQRRRRDQSGIEIRNKCVAACRKSFAII